MQYCIKLTLELTSSEKSVRFFHAINSFLENAGGGVTSMGVVHPSSPIPIANRYRNPITDGVRKGYLKSRCFLSIPTFLQKQTPVRRCDRRLTSVREVETGCAIARAQCICQISERIISELYVGEDAIRTPFTWHVPRAKGCLHKTVNFNLRVVGTLIA